MTHCLLIVLPSLTLIDGSRGPLQVCTRLQASLSGLVPADALVRVCVPKLLAGTILFCLGVLQAPLNVDCVPDV